MNSNNILITVSVIGLFLGILIIGAYAEDTGPAGTNLTPDNTTVNFSQINGSYDINQNGTNSSAQLSAESLGNSSETPVIYTGIEHPNEEAGINSSTPEGNPLIPKYALGGVNVDIMGHVMEARGNDSNVSAEVSFHDHTGVNGYINTVVKDFHYVSGVDTGSG